MPEPWLNIKIMEINELKDEKDNIHRSDLKMCQAGVDGECCDESCPQNRDNEPEKTGRFCPLPHWSDDLD